MSNTLTPELYAYLDLMANMTLACQMKKITPKTYLSNLKMAIPKIEEIVNGVRKEPKCQNAQPNTNGA